MINKLYDEIKNKIKQNYKFIICFFALLIVFTIKLPFYIEAPGGLIDISKRIEIDDIKEPSGSLNLSYVLSFKATLPTLIYAYFSPSWDIYEDEEIEQTESVEDIETRNLLLLKEASSNALIVGLNRANKDINITNRKIYINHIITTANTDLKIGDQIIEINDKVINSKEEIINIIKELTGKIKIKVINNNNEYIRYAYKQNIEGLDIIGISLIEICDIETDRNIRFEFPESESGPSGGFMMSLAIYNYLTEDITNNLTIVGTGTIDIYGNVGEIGGIEYKIKGASKEKADIFFVPVDNYEDAVKTVNENKLNIKIVKISTIDDAINYLKNL